MTARPQVVIAILLLLLAAPALAQPGVQQSPLVSFTFPRYSADANGNEVVGVPAGVRRWKIEYKADSGPWRAWWGGRSNRDKDGARWACRWTWQSGYRDSIAFRAAVADSSQNWTAWAYTSWRRP